MKNSEELIKIIKELQNDKAKDVRDLSLLINYENLSPTNPKKLDL